MDLTFTYQKKRSDMGRQCIFNDRGPELIDNYVSNPRLAHDYILRNPVNMAVQNTMVQAEHELNTYRAEYTNNGMNHVEGGWPKDVNTADEEQVKRYKRKVEKEENYPSIMGQLCKYMEDCILQNNAVNIYNRYYTDVDVVPLAEPSSARTVNVFTDQCSITRPISNISWSPDGGARLAVTHCNFLYQAPIAPHAMTSYIWDIENPNVPYAVLDPPEQSTCIQYSHKDGNILASGQFTGQVAVWDLRKGHQPILSSLMESSHRDPVQTLIWLSSKTGTEFFSGSTDGQVMWWDTRKLVDPIELLILDPVARLEDQNISNAPGCTVLEYEPTIPTRFNVGTEIGMVIAGNRKGKLPMEKMIAKYYAHQGPVLALQRNQAFPKNFLTIGDYTVRIWSEDCKESSIMWTVNHRPRLYDGGWSPTRYTVFFTCRSDGILDIWDILQNQEHAMISLKVCQESLQCMKINENGRFNCVGNRKGTAYLIEVSQNMTFSHKNDKNLLVLMFDRENKREKILEARNREIRLKQKTRSMPQAVKVDEDTDIFADPLVKAAEAEFFDIIDRELNPRVEERKVEEEGVLDLVDDDDEPEPEQK